jgi:hypothetical protein
MENQSHSDIVSEIDAIIRKGLWFDFHVLTYDGLTLTVAGGKDLIYFHELEIRFEGVFFVSGFFAGWHSDTKKEVFSSQVHDPEKNGTFEIETGHTLFRFKTDDYKTDVWIASESISYKTDTVFYYQREDLQPNQRIFIRPSSLKGG